MKVEEELLREALKLGLKTGRMPGDDVDCLEIGGKCLVLNVDGFEAKYVKLPFMDLRDVGWRGAVASFSDLIAKGVRPLGSLFSVYGKSSDAVKEISLGVFEALKEYDVAFLGADTNKGEEAIDVTSFGLAERVPRISGAREGDLVVVPRACWGCINLCLKGIELEECKRPKPKLEWAEVVSRYSDQITSSTDSSDGLAISLYKISMASNVKIVLEEVPKPNGVSEEEALYGGEEYAPVLAVRPQVAEEVAEELGGTIIGRVEKGEGVWYKGKRLEAKGWEWF